MSAFGGSSNGASRKKSQAKETQREVRRTTQRSQREVEREIQALNRQEKQLIDQVRAASKKSNEKEARLYAKQLVNLRATRQRLTGIKSTISTVGAQASTMASTAVAMEAMGNTAQLMGKVNAQVAQLTTPAQLRSFQAEMERMNIREEMLDESLADAFEDDELNEEADGIVEQTLAEIGIALDGQMLDAPTAAPVGTGVRQQREEAATADTGRTIADLEADLARLEAS